MLKRLCWISFCLLPAALQAQDLVEQAQDSVEQTLQAWAEDAIPVAQQEETYARLRGRIHTAGAQSILSLLHSKTLPRRHELLELLLQVPIEESRALLFDFARDESCLAGERGRVAEFLLLLDGHHAVDLLEPSLRADAEAPFLRRVYAGWRESVQPEDFALLEELARAGNVYQAQYALQLWALHETRPEARKRIYLLARDADSSFRAAALDALARQGKDPAIAAMLRAELDTSGAEMRRLARRLLPQFSGPEDLLQQYQQRAQNLSVNLRGRWMLDLAGSPLPAAQRLAMEWLVDGGWNSGIKAQQVVMLLGRSAEVDPLLPVLLHHGGIPERILFPLALARATTSADARAYLRALLPHAESVPQMKIVRALASRGEAEDLQLLRDIVESNAFSMAARSLAIEMLVEDAQARPLVERWLEEPLPSDYELASSWLRALGASENPQWSASAIKWALEAPGFKEEEIRRGLRIEVWTALGSRNDPRNRRPLEEQLLRLLRETPSSTPADESWQSLFRLSHEFSELNTVLQSLQACAMEEAPLVLSFGEDFSVAEVAADVLLSAAANLAYAYPQTATDWFRNLLSRDLSEVDRLRVLALMANRLPAGAARRQALAQLIAQPQKLEQWHLAMAEAFAPEGSSWILLAERLQERALVDAVEAGEKQLGALQELLPAYTEDSILARAAALAFGAEKTKENLDLAVRLAARRVDHMPLSDEAHAQLASFLEERGSSLEATQQWQIVLRLAPDFSQYWRQAQAALEQQDP